jgi:hypothetical protein
MQETPFILLLSCNADLLELTAPELLKWQNRIAARDGTVCDRVALA